MNVVVVVFAVLSNVIRDATTTHSQSIACSE